MPRKSKWPLELIFEKLIDYAKESPGNICVNAVERLEKETGFGGAYLRAKFFQPLKEVGALQFVTGGERKTKIIGVEMKTLDWDEVCGHITREAPAQKPKTPTPASVGKVKPAPANQLKLAAVGLNFDRIVENRKTEIPPLFERVLKLVESKCRLSSLDICSTTGERLGQAKEFLNPIIQRLTDGDVIADIQGFNVAINNLDQEIESWLKISAQFPGVEKVLVISAGSNFANLKKFAEEHGLEFESIDFGAPAPQESVPTSTPKSPEMPVFKLAKPAEPPPPAPKKTLEESEAFIKAAADLIRHGGRPQSRDEQFLADIIEKLDKMNQSGRRPSTEEYTKDFFWKDRLFQRWVNCYKAQDLAPAVNALIEKGLLRRFSGTSYRDKPAILVDVERTHPANAQIIRASCQQKPNLKLRGGLE